MDQIFKKQRRGLLCLLLLQMISSCVGLGCNDVVNSILHIAASVKEIPDGTYQFCTNFMFIQWEEGSQIESIGANAFANTDLRWIQIPPSNIKYIGANAFSDSQNFGTVTIGCHLQVLVIASDAFDRTPVTQIYLQPSVEYANPATVNRIPVDCPTPMPSHEPTWQPTGQPTPKPTTAMPTHEPTEQPTPKPTEQPTPMPTHEPTEQPTAEPTEQPTPMPTHEPTEQPTAEPTKQPTPMPTQASCGGGQYVKNKKTDRESCGVCPAGKFSKATTLRNRQCKKCQVNTYAHLPGSTQCIPCPQGFSTLRQRGKKQCFQGTGKA